MTHDPTSETQKAFVPFQSAFVPSRPFVTLRHLPNEPILWAYGAAAPSLDPAQVQQMVQSLAALRESVQQLAAGQESLAALAQTVDRLAAAQDQMARKVGRLQAADQEILVKIPESPPPPPIAAAPAVAGRPAPGGSPRSENTQNTAPTSASLPVGHAATKVALRASCGPDVQRLCRGISWENGGVIKCLNSHRMELSPTCDTYFNEMPVHPAAQKGAQRGVCKA
jgi:hypothetical protein